LGRDILSAFAALDGETQMRNIAAWTPVVAEVLQGFCSFDDATVGES
jgi:brefeldin A-inhibited guanine nucleotide-exchange protein